MELTDQNYTTARCGHKVIAEGDPGSKARKECESRTCGSPRCESGLDGNFTDRECAAYVWMANRSPWTVDLLTKTVRTAKREYANLIEFAQAYGWEG